MYLIGGPGGNPLDNPWKVGHWIWDDGALGWVEDVCNPVLEPDPGQWDGFTIAHIAVLFDGSEFRMWYGASASYHGVGLAGYATNADGECDWIKHGGNPLPGLEPGAPGTWDENGPFPSSVVIDGNTYHMYFTAGSGDTWDGKWAIGHATSVDGVSWTMDPDPVLEATEAWEEDKVTFPKVVRIGDGYGMWYTGIDMSPVTGATGYAISPDGVHWGKWPENPVLEPQPICTAAETLSVLFEDDMIHGWFAHCHDTTNGYDITHATSPFEVGFFDGFESGDTTVWGGIAP
jgi:hypothetical protein